MTLLVQDGRRGGHLKWALDALSAGVVGGVILSPFHTPPRTAVPHHYAGSRVVDDVLAQGGEVFFDASTYARLLPGTNDLVHYDSWQLWGPSGVGLDTPAQRFEHVEAVFARQSALGVPTLAPTVALDSPLGLRAGSALETARVAHGLDPACIQSLAGRRAFWRGGTDLDAYVGQLATLRPEHVHPHRRERRSSGQCPGLGRPRCLHRPVPYRPLVEQAQPGDSGALGLRRAPSRGGRR